MTDISPAKLSAKKSLSEYIISKKIPLTHTRACELPLQIKLYAYDALPVQLATRLHVHALPKPHLGSLLCTN